MRVPLRHRFRLDFEHKGWRGALRIVCGFIVIYLARQWPEYTAFRLESALQIGWIPLNVEEGAVLPYFTVFKRTMDVPPDWHRKETKWARSQNPR